MREIGASWTRSLRPKITRAPQVLAEREALVALLEVALEQVPRDRLDVLRACTTPWRAWLSASSSTSVA